MTYIYILENFAYSDFTYYLFAHEKHYTDDEFKEIVKEAMKKVKNTKFEWDFERKLFDVLKSDYGFVDGEDIVPIFHIFDLQKELKGDVE